jgi:hypothetical protein
VYILVHLEMPVRREVVGVAEALQSLVHLGVPGGRTADPDGAGPRIQRVDGRHRLMAGLGRALRSGP